MLPYRILRAAKNRYGATNELGMFDMTGQGLAEIKNPSQMLLEGRPLGVSGNCVEMCIRDSLIGAHQSLADTKILHQRVQGGNIALQAAVGLDGYEAALGTQTLALGRDCLLYTSTFPRPACW